MNTHMAPKCTMIPTRLWEGRWRQGERPLLLAILTTRTPGGWGTTAPVEELAHIMGESPTAAQETVNRCVNAGLIHSSLTAGLELNLKHPAIRWLLEGMEASMLHSPPCLQGVVPTGGDYFASGGRQVCAGGTSETSPFFQEFLDAYPRCEPATLARIRVAWDQAVARGATPELLVKRAREYRDNPRRHPMYTYGAPRWLTEDLWKHPGGMYCVRDETPTASTGDSSLERLQGAWLYQRPQPD